MPTRRENNLINIANIQKEIAKNDSIVQQRAADAKAAEYQKQIAEQTQRYEALYTQSQEAAAAAQARFEAQLAESKKANEATIAGLNRLLIDQQTANQQQAEQFAQAQAAAELRYNEQVARSARLSSAYIPTQQATAASPLVGDQRTASQRVVRNNQLSNLSIVNQPQRTNQLSGLQIA